MNFDYLGAKKAGLSDQQIEDSIRQHTGQGFNIEGATKAGLSDQQIQDSINAHIAAHDQVKTPQSQLTNLFPNPASNIPIVGGIVGQAQQLGNVAKDQAATMTQPVAAGEAKGIDDQAMELLKQAHNEKDPAKRKSLLQKASQLTSTASDITTKQLNSYSPDINKSPLERGVETGINAGTLVDLPSLPEQVTNIAKSFPELAKNLTYKGLNQKMEAAASAAKNIDWESLANDARNAAKDAPSSVKRALEKLIAEETPIPESNKLSGIKTPSGDVIHVGQKVANPELTGNQALSLRRSLSSRLPKGFFGEAMSKMTDEEKAAINILRRATSSALKDVAPDIKTPDALYSFYKKIGGDVPTWAKRLIGEQVADKVLGKKAGGTGEAVIDLLGGFIGGKF